MVQGQFLLALDQGTTSSRAIVFDREGRMRGVDQREFHQHYPQPGWVEHDATEIWSTQLATARGALTNAGAQASDIAAIGITNQRETTVLWERATGRPVAHALVWQDRRTAAFCEKLRQDGHADWLQERTGLVVDAYFSGTKLAWLLDNVPGARAAAERGELAFGTVDTWLAWQLTGGAVHSTDDSNASRTMLYDLRKRDWDDEILALLNIPRGVLPNIAPSSGVIGHAMPDLLGGAIPIAGVAGDQQAATFGQACLRPGEAKNTYGTGNFLLLNTGTEPVRSKSGLLTTVCYQFGAEPPVYALEGSIAVTGSAVQWLRDQLGIISGAAQSEALARQVDDNGGVYFVPAFSGLFAPYWRSDARGAIVGLSRYNTNAHLARATLESICYQTRDVVEAMRQDSGVKLDVLRVDGGVTANELCMELQADILGVPVSKPVVAETTALGAAYAAGLATGFWRDTEELRRNWNEDRRWEPRWSDERRTAGYAGWKKAVDRTLGWVDVD